MVDACLILLTVIFPMTIAKVQILFDPARVLPKIGRKIHLCDMMYPGWKHPVLLIAPMYAEKRDVGGVGLAGRTP